MPPSQLTWGEIKEFMEANQVSDDASINLEVGIKGSKPELTINGWANGIAQSSTYTVILRYSP